MAEIRSPLPPGGGFPCPFDGAAHFVAGVMERISSCLSEVIVPLLKGSELRLHDRQARRHFVDCSRRGGLCVYSRYQRVKVGSIDSRWCIATASR